MDIEKRHILDTVIKNVLTNEFTNVNYSNSSYYNFRCNICGDSKINKYKKRGYILKKDRYVYYCHNCGASMGAISWLKRFFHSYYLQYKSYLFNTNTDELDRKEKEFEEKLKKEKIEEIKRKKINEVENLKYAERLDLKSKNKLHLDATEFCKKRKIPLEKIKTFYVVVDGFYKNRLLIPFRNKKNKTIYYQCRALYNDEPKYLNRPFGKTNAIYNFDFVDKNNIVIILEGVIDSFFVENSISVLGTKIKTEVYDKIDRIPNKVFLFDNDADGRSFSLKYLKKGHYVFNWKKFLAHYKIINIKDINDFIISSNKDFLTIKDLKPFFTNNIYDTIYFT